MDFMPEAELWRLVSRARGRRVSELVALGVPPPHARQQAGKEFSVYDQIEIDDRGWIRLTGFEPPEE